MTNILVKILLILCASYLLLLLLFLKKLFSRPLTPFQNCIYIDSLALYNVWFV